MNRSIAVTCLAASSLVACISERPIMGNQTCPCAPGWTCDIATNHCVPGSANPDGGPPDVPVNGNPDGPDPDNRSNPDIPPDWVLPTFNQAQVQAALAQCDLPHGPVTSTATYGDKRAIMIGGWIVCPPAATTVFAPAIVFAPDGTFNRYLYDANGGLAAAYGVQNQGAYLFPFADFVATNGNPYVLVAAASRNYEPSDYSSGAMTFEMSPTRMHVVITYLDQNIEVWLVPLR